MENVKQIRLKISLGSTKTCKQDIEHGACWNSFVLKNSIYFHNIF
jgi:hypothetical protein